MNKDHLQPEIRVDKNGVPVTRYVRPSGAGNPKSALPAPLASVPTAYTHIARVGALINKMDPNSTMAANRKFKARNKLETFDSSTLDILEAAAEWNAARSAPEGQFMYFTLMQYDEDVVRATAFCRPMFTLPVTSIEAREIVAGIRCLERYKSLDRVESLSGKEWDIMAALLNVTAVTYQHGRTDDVDYDNEKSDNGMYLTDPKVQEVVAAHYQQSDAIMRHIEERGAADPDTILEYLNNGTVLADGAL